MKHRAIATKLESQHLLTADVARILNVTPATVRQMSNAGKLHPVRSGAAAVRIFDAGEVTRVAAERAARVKAA